jgi:hypothetical protein
MTKDYVIPSNPADIEKIRRVMNTVSDCFTRIEAERDLIKDEIGALVEEFEIPRSVLNRMARIHHKQNFEQVVSETEEFGAFYEKVMETK